MLVPVEFLSHDFMRNTVIYYVSHDPRLLTLGLCESMASLAPAAFDLNRRVSVCVPAQLVNQSIPTCDSDVIHVI